MMSWLPAALVGHLWQSTWFAAVVWLATLALRHNSARLRYWLWTTASVKFLVPFSWLVSLGAQFEWRTAPAVARPAAAFVMEQVFAPSVLVAAPETMSHQAPVLPLLLAGVWLVGAAAALFWWWRQWLPVRAALRAATHVTLPGHYDVAGLAVMASPSMLEPGVIGFRRPVLLVPAGLVERLTPAQMNALLAHERCHVRCHDNLLAAMHMAVEAIFWFHPVVWWIAARQIDERERACDEAVLCAGSQPSDYAEGILTVCRWSLGSPVMCVSGITGSDLRTRIESIMANRVGLPLNGAGRMLLASAAAMVLVGPVGLGLLDAAAQSSNTSRPPFDVVSIKRTPENTGLGAEFRAIGQAPVDAKPSFDVATIRRNDSLDPDNVQFTPGGGFRATNVSLLVIVAMAYSESTFALRSSQIVGAPAWLTSERYNIAAKPPDGATPPDDQKLATARRRLQSLLEDRFKIRVRRDQREMPVYALVHERADRTLGRSITRSAIDCGTHADQCGRIEGGPTGRIRSDAMTPAALSVLLANVTGRVVVDRTGLDGWFAVDLQWSPDQTASDKPSLFTAVQEQLGLKLESTKGSVDVLVIDHVEKPTEN